MRAQNKKTKPPVGDSIKAEVRRSEMEVGKGFVGETIDLPREFRCGFRVSGPALLAPTKYLSIPYD
ncbi:MAG TPA: hypothetical protein GXZ78_01380 [Eubacteriaceae bacterium]|nr:hypothetical protein [Eubacteriaceae bacterium]